MKKRIVNMGRNLKDLTAGEIKKMNERKIRQAFAKIRQRRNTMPIEVLQKFDWLFDTDLKIRSNGDLDEYLSHLNSIAEKEPAKATDKQISLIKRLVNRDYNIKLKPLEKLPLNKYQASEIIAFLIMVEKEITAKWSTADDFDELDLIENEIIKHYLN